MTFEHYNRTATFDPQDEREFTRPCVTVGGAQVYVYVDDGADGGARLRVSIHLDDDVDPGLVDDDRVPVCIKVNDYVVWEA